MASSILVRGALLVMMPFIRSTFAIGDVAYGTLFAISSISSGIANVPAGMLADMYRKRVAWLLTISMLMVGAGYFLIGISPWVWLIALSIAVVGFGTSMWHAPAFGTLAARYPRRRGVAMSASLDRRTDRQHSKSCDHRVLTRRRDRQFRICGLRLAMGGDWRVGADVSHALLQCCGGSRRLEPKRNTILI